LAEGIVLSARLDSDQADRTILLITPAAKLTVETAADRSYDAVYDAEWQFTHRRSGTGTSSGGTPGRDGGGPGGGGPGTPVAAPPPPPQWVINALTELPRARAGSTITLPRPHRLPAGGPGTRVTDPGPAQTGKAGKRTVEPPPVSSPYIGLGPGDVADVLAGVSAAEAANEARTGRRVDENSCLKGTSTQNEYFYWPLDGLDRATGAAACLVREQRGTAATGRPKDLGNLDAGHLIARELGGNGRIRENLVPLHHQSNIAMRSFAETLAAKRVRQASGSSTPSCRTTTGAVASRTI
jgi:hypothetical protein